MNEVSSRLLNTQIWNPSLYDSRAEFVSRLAGDLVSLLEPKPSERILDLGCGTGDLSAELAKRGANVVGVDASQDMIRQAQRKYPALEFAVEDGQELRFEAEFDAVFSNAALHWMKRAEDTARGIAGALKPGGRLVAEFGGAGCVQTVRSACTSVLQAWGETSLGPPDWYFPSVGVYSSLLESLGFSVRWAALFERPTPMSGDSGLEDWLELFCSELLFGLGERRAAFVREVAALARPKLYRAGVWTMDYVRLRIVALKG